MRSLFLLALFALLSGGLKAQSRTVAEQYLFQSVNAERASAGLAPLRWNGALTAAAHDHAEQMRAQRSIAHQFGGEADLTERAAAAGAHFSRVTENVAISDSVPTMHAALMQSQHHRENILDPDVTSIGIAVVASRGEFWGVEDFSRDVAILSIDQQEREVARLLQGTGLRSISITDNARTTCRMQSGYVGERPWFVMRYTTSDLDLLPEQLRLRIAGGRYHGATIGACTPGKTDHFTSYSLAVLLFP